MKKISAAELQKQKQEIARQILSKKTPKQQYNQEQVRVNEFAQIYEKALSVYKEKPIFKVFSGVIKPDNPDYNTFLFAIKLADEMNVDFNTYITAQFCYCFKRYGRYPRVIELISKRTEVPAKARVEWYLSEERV